jgi:hypothetical protein
MKELLEALDTHSIVAFWVGIFLLLLLGGLGSWIVLLVRSITGNYPPPGCDCRDDSKEEESE